MRARTASTSKRSSSSRIRGPSGPRNSSATRSRSVIVGAVSGSFYDLVTVKNLTTNQVLTSSAVYYDVSAAGNGSIAAISARSPYFIKNPVAVSGRLDRFRGSTVALKIPGQSGTVSEHFDWNLLHAVLGPNGHPLCRIFRCDGNTAPGARATVRARPVTTRSWAGCSGERRRCRRLAVR